MSSPPAGRPPLRSRALLPFAVLLSACAACRGGNHISVDPASVSLISTGGLSTPSQTVLAHYDGAGLVVGTLPGQSKPPWLDTTAQILSPTSTQITLSGWTHDRAPGRYSCVLRFATADANGTNVASEDVLVSLTVPQTVSPTFLVVNLDSGTGTSVARTLTLSGTDIEWEATASAPWMKLPVTSGSGPASLALDIDASGLAPGDYAGTVTIRDTFTNQTQTVSVTLGIAPHRLLVAEPAIGFFAIGSKTRLSRALRVFDNAHVPTAWTANSDQKWLALDAMSGTTDDALTATADPTGLSSGMHYANVTLTPANAGDGTQPVTVRVGLYVDADGIAADEPVVPVTVSSFSLNYPDLAADPLRPFFYFSGVGEDIAVYNGQTGALVGGIKVAGAKFAAMAVSGDGASLYVQDSGSGNIYPVDLETRTVGTALTGARIAQDLAWSRVDGRDFIFTSECQAIDATSGELLADLLKASRVLFPSAVVAARDGHALFMQGGSLANHGLARFETSARSGKLVMTLTQSFNERGDGGGGLAVDFASTSLFSVSPSGQNGGGNRYDSATLTRVTPIVVGENYIPTADGSLLYSNTALNSSSSDKVTTIRALAPDLSKVAGSVQVAGTAAVMRLSGDDHRLAVFGYTAAKYRIAFIDRL